MLKLELTRSTEELAAEVGGRCAAFGQVTKVTVYPARSGAPALSPDERIQETA